MDRLHSPVAHQRVELAIMVGTNAAVIGCSIAENGDSMVRLQETIDMFSGFRLVSC